MSNVFDEYVRLKEDNERLREALREVGHWIEEEQAHCWCSIPSMIPYRGHVIRCANARAALAGAQGPNHYDPTDEIRREVQKRSRALAERVREACVQALVLTAPGQKPPRTMGENAQWLLHEDVTRLLRSLNLDALLKEGGQ